MKTPFRTAFESQLKKIAPTIKGKVLEVGAAKWNHKRFFPHCEYITTDVNKSDGVAEIADVRNLNYTNESFDCVVCFNVLEHVIEKDTAVKEILRVLKPGGVAIIVTPFFIPMHDIPYDYWRFTKYGLETMLKSFNKVSVKPVAVLNFWIFKRMPMGYFVIAEK